MKVLAKKLGRPCDTDAGETRNILVKEARRSFADVGYDATTNRALAQAAGITTGAIYHYFPSKLDMYVAAYAEMQEVVQSTFEAAAAKHETFTDKFSAILDSIALMSAEDPSLASFVVGVASESQRHPELSKAIAPLRVGLGQFWRKCAPMLLPVVRLFLELMLRFCKTSSMLCSQVCQGLPQLLMINSAG